MREFKPACHDIVDVLALVEVSAAWPTLAFNSTAHRIELFRASGRYCQVRLLLREATREALPVARLSHCLMNLTFLRLVRRREGSW